MLEHGYSQHDYIPHKAIKLIFFLILSNSEKKHIFFYLLLVGKNVDVSANSKRFSEQLSGSRELEVTVGSKMLVCDWGLLT